MGSKQTKEEKISPTSVTKVTSKIDRANGRTVFSNFPTAVAQLIKEENYYPLLLFAPSKFL